MLPASLLVSTFSAWVADPIGGFLPSLGPRPCTNPSKPNVDTFRLGEEPQPTPSRTRSARPGTPMIAAAPAESMGFEAPEPTPSDALDCPTSVDVAATVGALGNRDVANDEAELTLRAHLALRGGIRRAGGGGHTGICRS